MGTPQDTKNYSKWSTKAHNREKNTWKKGSRYKVVKIHENSGEKIFKVLQFYNDTYDFQQRPQRQTHFEAGFNRRCE